MGEARPARRVEPTGGSWRSKLAARAPRGRPPASGLHIVATPIGHGDDITLRALDTLEAADLIACEDTRVTARLLALFGIRTPLLAYHDHNADRVRPRIMEALESGAVVALVSDAGTPLVSDPGYRLVRAVLAEGHAVVPVPGPASPLAALTVAGLPSDRFCFAGFLPVKTAARRTELETLAAIPATLLVFESGPRLAASLQDMAGVLGPREAAVARELTKTFEEVRRGALDTLAAAYADEAPPKGEIVVVIAPPQRARAEAGKELDAALVVALGALPLKSAVEQVTAETGLPRRTVYQRALALRDGETP